MQEKMKRKQDVGKRQLGKYCEGMGWHYIME